MVASAFDKLQVVAGSIFVTLTACLWLSGFYVGWQSRQIYKSIGNYSIGLSAFNWQLAYPGISFPGPNVLEAELAKQPDDFKAHVQAVRRRIRYLNWAVLIYVGFFLLVGPVFAALRRMLS
jgi:hypothetical protein